MKSLKLINHVHKSIEKACNNESQIDDSVLGLEGMSCARTRHLFNNLCSNNVNNYMEVGSYLGSTICSSISNNNLKNAYYFENFSEFQDRQKKEVLENNIKKHKNKTKIHAYYEDFFTNVKNKGIKNIDLFFYDGQHNQQVQRANLPLSHSCMSDYFIYVVDDWFCKASKPYLMTWDTIIRFNFKVISFTELPHRGMSEKEGFHGGLGIFVIENHKQDLNVTVGYN